ncbi:carboxypeptidase-like regulatory domain-containing protein [Arthrobacter sp. SW1]|uniref:carboxypeptidase-like regulatory domain-containing protein n=1 Tax=Arthrobacter sp. SW1 TaxID=1920889 RepID=UPI0011131054|nr:carboxypeptidase-like regulatory domain-containing protein [Arthrobacter sp. SW1]
MVILGPQCPVEQEGVPCPSEPPEGVPVIVSEQLPGELYAPGREVARTATDAKGAFRIDIAPGKYVVTAEAGMSCELMDVTVATAEYARVTVPCDTGIR